MPYGEMRTVFERLVRRWRAATGSGERSLGLPGSCIGSSVSSDGSGGMYTGYRWTRRRYP